MSSPSSSSEENVHMEVVVVTTPDTPDQEEKSILETEDLEEEHMMEQSLESEADSSASIALPKDAVLVKLSEVPDGDGEILYPITCGDSKANLVWKKFVCPGINIKCVQLNEHLISPKEFVYLSGKSTLKDWKRAIRLNGIMLRKIMDSGELDFYQHSRLCSNTCRSTKIDLVGSRGSLSSQQSTDTAPPTPASADDGSDDSTEWVTAIGEDTVAFWRGLRDAGLLEEVMEDLHQQVTEILKGLEERLQETPLQPKDAALLNNIVQNFGMLDLVKKVLASHKSQMDRCREQYTRSLVALEQQCDEHRKRAKELKSKSQHLNNVLMTLTPVTSPPSAKRPRLTRAASGPASVSAAQAPPSHFTLPIAQLAQSSLIGGYTLLTSPGGAELQADASNVTLLNAAPATPALVKVVSPFQLVTLPSVRALTSPVGGATGNAVVSASLSTANTEVAKSATKQKTGQLEKE